MIWTRNSGVAYSKNPLTGKGAKLFHKVRKVQKNRILTLRSLRSKDSSGRFFDEFPVLD
jgi:hypothetical protein